MTTFTMIDFCEKHAIKWFPISLTIVRQTDDNEGSKTLNNINHPLYKGVTQKGTPTYKTSLFLLVIKYMQPPFSILCVL